MPTLPMYRTDVAAPQWRALFAPGGYEYYEIHIPAQLLLRIGIGNPFSSEYRQLHQRYLQSPTQYPPALPAEFPFALLEHSGQRTLLDGCGMELKLTGSSSIQLGPAAIAWGGAVTHCSWANAIADLPLEVSPEISIQTDRQSEIREFSLFRTTSSDLSATPGQIAHVFRATT